MRDRGRGIGGWRPMGAAMVVAMFLGAPALGDEDRRVVSGLGQPVEIAVADLPALSLKGEIKELGSRAEQVSAFPVVVKLENNVPGLNAGMSVEVAVEEPLIGGGNGFLVPLTVLIPQGGKDLQGAASIFLYDPATSTVKKHAITAGGIRDNDPVAAGARSAQVPGGCSCSPIGRRNIRLARWRDRHRKLGNRPLACRRRRAVAPRLHGTRLSSPLLSAGIGVAIAANLARMTLIKNLPNTIFSEPGSK